MPVAVHFMVANGRRQLYFFPVHYSFDFCVCSSSRQIVDFSAFQTSPQPTEAALLQCLRPFWHKCGAKDVFEKTPHAPAAAAMAAVAAPEPIEAVAGKFTVCSGSALDPEEATGSGGAKAAKWAAWYDPCFARVAASSKIEAVDKAPMNATALPPCLLTDDSRAAPTPHSASESSSASKAFLLERRSALRSACLLRRAFALYVDLLLDPRTITGFQPATGIHIASKHTGGSSQRSPTVSSENVSSANSRARALASELDPLHGALWRRAAAIAHERAEAQRCAAGGSSTAADVLAADVASLDSIVDALVFAPLRKHTAARAAVLTPKADDPLPLPPLLPLPPSSSLIPALWGAFDLAALAALLLLNLTFAAVSYLNLRLRYPDRNGCHLESKEQPGPHEGEPQADVRFTVVIPAFNEAACIGAALTSVTRRSGLVASSRRIPSGNSVDVVVVDGGSTDGTEAAVRAFVAAHSEAFCLSSEERAHRPLPVAAAGADTTAASEAAGAHGVNGATDGRVSVRLARSTGGRGPALARGVSLAKASSLHVPSISHLEAVVLLHADSELPDGWALTAAQALADSSVGMAAFPFRLKRRQEANDDAAGTRASLRRWSVAVLEWSAGVRSARFEMPFGDQVRQEGLSTLHCASLRCSFRLVILFSFRPPVLPCVYRTCDLYLCRALRCGGPPWRPSAACRSCPSWR
jgi:GT2 family glycosyltransferase